MSDIKYPTKDCEIKIPDSEMEESYKTEYKIVCYGVDKCPHDYMTRENVKGKLRIICSYAQENCPHAKKEYL